jgi:hypothetical protein
MKVRIFRGHRAGYAGGMGAVATMKRSATDVRVDAHKVATRVQSASYIKMLVARPDQHSLNLNGVGQ